jgi:hypothetical protein
MLLLNTLHTIFRFSSLIQHYQGMVESFKDSKMSRRNSRHNSHYSDSASRQSLHEMQSQSTSLRIPPSPPLMEHVDYPDAAFWTQQSWQEYSHRRDQQGEVVKKLGFICNEDGEYVGTARIKDMTDTAKQIWNHLHHHRLAPATWRLVSKEADEYYSNSMRAAFLEFQLCEGSWKAKQFATICFPDWSNGPRASGNLTRCKIPFSPVFYTNLLYVGAIPSIDTHVSTSTSQLRGKRAFESGEDWKSSEKRQRTAFSVQTNAVDLTSDTDHTDARASPAPSIFSTGIAAKKSGA